MGKVIWQSETPLNAKRMQAPTAPVNGILGDEVDERADYERQITENKHYADADQRKRWMHFMLDKSYYFKLALPTYRFNWSKKSES